MGACIWFEGFVYRGAAPAPGFAQPIFAAGAAVACRLPWRGQAEGRCRLSPFPAGPPLQSGVFDTAPKGAGAGGRNKNELIFRAVLQYLLHRNVKHGCCVRHVRVAMVAIYIVG